MITLYFLVALAVVVVVASGVIAYRARRLLAQLGAELQEQKYRRLQEPDVAIADWLEMPELLQLAEETKRLKVARRLRTVLIEKPLRSRVPCYSPNTKWQGRPWFCASEAQCQHKRTRRR